MAHHRLPLHALRAAPPTRPPGQVVLLIDGVDEADGRAGSLDNNVMRLLREHFPKLHPAVHLVVSCRQAFVEEDPLATLRVRGAERAIKGRPVMARAWEGLGSG